MFIAIFIKVIVSFFIAIVLNFFVLRLVYTLREITSEWKDIYNVFIVTTFFIFLLVLSLILSLWA